MHVVCYAKRWHEVSRLARKITENYEDIDDLYLEFILDDNKKYKQKIEDEDYRNVMKWIFKNAFPNHLKMLSYSLDAKGLLDVPGLFNERLASDIYYEYIPLPSGENISFSFSFDYLEDDAKSFFGEKEANFLKNYRFRISIEEIGMPVDFFCYLAKKIKQEIINKASEKEIVLKILDAMCQAVVKKANNKKYVFFGFITNYFFDTYITIENLTKKSLKLVFDIKDDDVFDILDFSETIEIKLYNPNKDVIIDVAGMSYFTKNTYDMPQNEAAELINHTIKKYIVKTIIDMYIKKSSLWGFFSKLFKNNKMHESKQIAKFEEAKKYVIFEINTPKEQRGKSKWKTNKLIVDKIILEIVLKNIEKIIDFISQKEFSEDFFVEKQIDSNKKIVRLYLTNKENNKELLCEVMLKILVLGYYIKIALLDMQYWGKTHVDELLKDGTFAEILSLLGLSLRHIEVIKRLIELDFLRISTK